MTFDPKEARALVDELHHRMRMSDCWCPNRRAAAAITAALDEIERLQRALTECSHEIDEYIRQEYPADHPVHERYRRRDFEANPARLALKGADQ